MCCLFKGRKNWNVGPSNWPAGLSFEDRLTNQTLQLQTNILTSLVREYFQAGVRLLLHVVGRLPPLDLRELGVELRGEAISIVWMEMQQESPQAGNITHFMTTAI